MSPGDAPERRGICKEDSGNPALTCKTWYAVFEEERMGFEGFGMSSK